MAQRYETEGEKASNEKKKKRRKKNINENPNENGNSHRRHRYFNVRNGRHLQRRSKKKDEANDSYRMQIWMRMRVCGMASVRYGWKGKNIQKTDKRFALKWNIMQIVRAGIK